MSKPCSCGNPTRLKGKTQCADCVNTYRRANRHKWETPESRRDSTLWKKYRIRQADYDEIYKSQHGKCAICDIPSTDAPRGLLAVDHDHETGEVRGLLCDACNTALGKFKDSPKILLEAVSYLRAGV